MRDNEGYKVNEVWRGRELKLDIEGQYLPRLMTEVYRTVSSPTAIRHQQVLVAEPMAGKAHQSS